MITRRHLLAGIAASAMHPTLEASHAAPDTRPPAARRSNCADGYSLPPHKQANVAIGFFW